MTSDRNYKSFTNECEEESIMSLKYFEKKIFFIDIIWLAPCKIAIIFDLITYF